MHNSQLPLTRKECTTRKHDLNTALQQVQQLTTRLSDRMHRQMVKKVVQQSNAEAQKHVAEQISNVSLSLHNDRCI